MTKKQYVDQGILKLAEKSLAALFPYGAFFLVLMSVLDYFVTPENFGKFLIYRLIAASLVIGLFLVFKLKEPKSERFMLTMIIAVTLIVAAMVELMVFSFGGHQSTYYAGMIVVITFILGFLLIPFKTSLLIGSLVYAVYLLPLLLFDTITNVRLFINNNIFLLASILGAFGWKFFYHRVNVKNLSLEYDHSKDKELLEMYSTQLEQLVEERTRELNKSELMLWSLFENANDGIVIMDRNGIILNVNQKACEIHGFERDALISINIGLLETEENKQLFKERKERILNGESMMFETQHYRKDGSRVSLEISSKALEVDGALFIQSFHRDVTDRKRLQEQLFQSQKMESIGVLAGGIAHDFNNILSAILGHSELLYEFGNLDVAAKQKVKIIENSARKAGQMISKLLSFARKGSFEIVPLSVNDVIRDTIDLLERMMSKKNVTIKLDIEDTIPPVNGDGNQIEQVVMNLVVNAADAMPEGGTVTISTSLANLEKNASVVHPLLAPRKYIALRVSDTGTGIRDEIKDKIFDPFFTTKATGKGTGLGLAMVYGIVKEHGGAINVQSRLGEGTTFEVYLPTSDRLVPKAEKTALYSIAGREKILVVDDEEDIASFIRDVLETQGYKVLLTNNPVYALDIFRKISEDIDLVITDLVMPLVNGRELAGHLKTIKPTVKIIAISGYDMWNTGKKDKDMDAYIRKPFEGIYLLSIVRRVLDSKGSAPVSRHSPL